MKIVNWRLTCYSFNVYVLMDTSHRLSSFTSWMALAIAASGRGITTLGNKQIWNKCFFHGAFFILILINSLAHCQKPLYVLMGTSHRLSSFTSWMALAIAASGRGITTLGNKQIWNKCFFHGAFFILILINSLINHIFCGDDISFINF